MNNKISIRYAKTLFELGKEQKCLEDIHANMVDYLMLCKTIGELNKHFSKPILSVVQKKRLFAALFEKPFHKISFSFLSLMISKGRADMFIPLAQDFIDLYNAHHRITPIHIIAPQKILPQSQKEIETFLEAKFDSKIEATYSLDESIIGGLIISTKNKQLDISAKTKLRNIRKKLLNS